MGYDRYGRDPQVLEGGDRLQRKKGHVPCLHLLGQLRMNKLRLLSGGDMRSIADGCVYLLFSHFSWKGDRESVICCMAEE